MFTVSSKPGSEGSFGTPAALDEARKKYAEDIEFYKMLQYLFFKQWRELKAYANENGIEIIGDVPIYVAGDSADVWANPKQFYLDEDLNPIEVAGCPPDGFSADGQLWGNPLFRWDEMKKDNYAWWTKRIKAMSELYDIIRIDHFRGFDSYYAIPAKDKTAKNGKWKQGPGMDLFNQLEKKLGKLPIIVEDLGFLTDSVRKLLKDSGFPGMKVIQFAFDSREGSDYLPHTYTSHCVVYTGTHDNDTVMGWMKTAPKASVKFATEYLNLTEEEGYNWGMMRAAWSSVADMAIVPMQDLIGLGSEARINIPSTLGENWKWNGSVTGRRAKPNQIVASKQSPYLQRMTMGTRSTPVISFLLGQIQVLGCKLDRCFRCSASSIPSRYHYHVFSCIHNTVTGIGVWQIITSLTAVKRKLDDFHARESGIL